MQGIQKAIKRQQLRKYYSQGVNVSPVIQAGGGLYSDPRYYIEITNIKDGSTFRECTYAGYLAILPATVRRDAIVEGFKECGIHVTEGFYNGEKIYRKQKNEKMGWKH